MICTPGLPVFWRVTHIDYIILYISIYSHGNDDVKHYILAVLQLTQRLLGRLDAELLAACGGSDAHWIFGYHLEERFRHLEPNKKTPSDQQRYTFCGRTPKIAAWFWFLVLMQQTHVFCHVKMIYWTLFRWVGERQKPRSVLKLPVTRIRLFCDRFQVGTMISYAVGDHKSVDIHQLVSIRESILIEL